MIIADRVVFSGGAPPEFPLRTVAQLRAHGGIVARLGRSGGRPDPADPGRARSGGWRPARPWCCTTGGDESPSERQSVAADDRAGRLMTESRAAAGDPEDRRAGRRCSSCSRSSGPGTCTRGHRRRLAAGHVAGRGRGDRRRRAAGHCRTWSNCRTVGSAPTWSAAPSAMLVDIYGEVVPSGWRISRRPGRDTSRAKDFLAWDLDAAQEQYAGAEWVKVQVCGPWTLAADARAAVRSSGADRPRGGSTTWPPRCRGPGRASGRGRQAGPGRRRRGADRRARPARGADREPAHGKRFRHRRGGTRGPGASKCWPGWPTRWGTIPPSPTAAMRRRRCGCCGPVGSMRCRST